MTFCPARERFNTLIHLPDHDLPLAEVALCIAWEDQGFGDPDLVLQQLDGIAGAVRLRIEDIIDPHEVIATLNAYLFEELGFRGNNWDYYNPKNSFIDHVLETRIGLPITLSIIYMEIGWRLGLPMTGVALPGHFIARYAGVETEIFIDPFNRGHLWSRHECERQVLSTYGSTTPIMLQQILEPPSKRDIVMRMLRNLKNTYLSNEDFLHALAAAERILFIEPQNALELRDRGLLRARLGQLYSALEDLERYAQLVPHALDLPELQQYTGVLVAEVAARN